MNLGKQNLCGARLCYHFDLVRRDDFAARREVSVKVYVTVYDAGCRRGVRGGRWIVAKRRLGLDVIILASSFHRL